MSETGGIIGILLLDTGWVCVAVFLTLGALQFSFGSVNTRTDYLMQSLKVTVGSLFLMGWFLARTHGLS